MDSSNSLRVKDAISARYQTAFKFECFNKMQSILLPSVYRHDKNLAVASPTGNLNDKLNIK